ncbi:MAG: group III truncated hemoglobin [Gammaproteobacteria bacterium]|nr:group III truncated hemoglobin [Gammaproteobacteria bacterium]
MSQLTDQLNLSDIRRVTQQFYLKARHDPIIGHYFDHIDDFTSHEEKISAFWWLALGGTTAELPAAVPSFDMINKHILLGIKESDLTIWLGHFEQTLFETLETELASAWKAKAFEIASHLKALAIEGKSGGIHINN